MKMVRQKTPRRDTVSNSPLHQSAYIGDYINIQSILAIPENRKNINQLNHLGCSPLRLAATSGEEACVKFLIALGADVNIPDIKGQTPLFVAVKNNHPRCVEALLSKSADPNGSPKCLSTPVYIAAMQGLDECLELLLQAGADVNCSLTKGQWGNNTPLQVSFTYRHQKCFRMLLLGGADPNCRLTDKDLESNPSLLDAAIRWGDIYFVKLLFEFGGKMTNNSRRWKSNSFDQNLRSEENRELDAYITYMKTPRSLETLCRSAIRSSLGVKRLTSLNELPLPATLRKYLQHSAS
ncbi:ankyrin repeat and SOCS box protein 1-like [Asterias amurensis]|uniref:ankyrin repeat and SOCS box protein 1-like n=1 Tax=Asterias amurensis TaxID=7602 RepID=UPI003AB6E05E